jgi:adenylosuccinate lyase
VIVCMRSRAMNEQEFERAIGCSEVRRVTPPTALGYRAMEAVLLLVAFSN